MYHLSLLILESYEYGLLLLLPLICTASDFLMLVFPISQPTYMLFHNILKKPSKKPPFCFLGFFWFFGGGVCCCCCFKFKVCPALFISVVFQMCMANELQSQHRPSVKSVTRIVPREELQTRCASCPLSKTHPTAEALTAASHHCTSQLIAPEQQCHSNSCKIKHQLC